MEARSWTSWSLRGRVDKVPLVPEQELPAVRGSVDDRWLYERTTPLARESRFKGREGNGQPDLHASDLIPVVVNPRWQALRVEGGISR